MNFNKKTKLLIIREMMCYKVPISMYRIAKILKMSLSLVYYHVQSLIESGVILCNDKKYEINSCFKYINDFAELLLPFIEALYKSNPELNRKQLNDLASYMLAMKKLI